MDAIRSLAASIDHTLLSAGATRDDIRQLCREAAEEGFAAVCVNPVWVGEAARELASGGVAVAAVVGFPLGATTTGAKVAEAHEALAAGARELDMVIQVGLLRGGEHEAVGRDIAAVAALVRDGAGLLKVIIETCVLSDEEKAAAVRLAVEAGADFVKTSTGFGKGGATIEDVALMRRIAPARVGVKASGGIRSFAQARAMLAAGATRLGSSSGVAIMAEARRWYAGR
jgi:deoxyribose-phosphate aldolase